MKVFVSKLDEGRYIASAILNPGDFTGQPAETVEAAVKALADDMRIFGLEVDETDLDITPINF